MQLPFQNCQLDIHGLVIVEFFTNRCKEVAHKLCRNCRKLTLENSVFQDLGHSEEIFDHKLGNIFEKHASDLALSSGTFRSNILLKSSNLK